MKTPGGPMYLELTTEKLRLRSLTTEDLVTTHEYAGNVENARYMLFLPNDTIEETRKFLEYSQEEWKKESPDDYEFAILFQGKHIGAISVELSEDKSEAELGWIIHRDYWKQGIVSEAAEVIKKFAFQELKVKKLVAHCDERNVGSYKVMEKIGMVLVSKDGIRIDKQTKMQVAELKYQILNPEQRVYYIFSDIDTDTKFEIAVEQMKKDFVNRKHLVFIASNPEIGEITDQYAQMYENWFDFVGLGFEKYTVIDNRLTRDEMLNQIQTASVVYLMGGTTPLQIKFLKEMELVDSLRNFQGIVMGLSAGAINMAKTAVCTVSCQHEKLEIYEGVGLTNYTVEPHFESEDLAEELLQLSKNYPIYGMCDGSLIIIRGEETVFLGDIYSIQNGKVEKI